uniref:Glycosyl transferase group 1 n=1 Tax=Methanococcus maripaludis (strain C6 / ATCC BAA-1332) TaxID=444158 RepID=A9A6X1_METM6
MKITLIGPTYPYKGGISHYTTTLANELSKSNEISVYSYTRQYPKIIYPGKEQKDSESKIRLKDNINCKYLLDTINPLSWINCSLHIIHEKPDLIIFQWVHPFFAPIFYLISKIIKEKLKIPVIYVCHNALPHEKIPLIKKLSKMALSTADGIIVHSKEDFDNLKEIIPNSNIKISVHPTYNIFSENEEHDLSKSKSEKIHQILFFGIVREYKGLKYLINAMPKILSKINAELVIAGEFWENESEYLNEIENLGIKKNIKLINEYIPDDEISKYFKNTDIVALPYISATQSGVIQIAYAFEKPVITTNVGGLPDVVDDGKTGFLVPPENSEKLADAIIKYFSENKKEEFIKNIRQKNKEFSWDRLIEDIFDLLKK